MVPELAALIMKPVFSLLWAVLLYIWFSFFHCSLPSKFLYMLLSIPAKSGPSVLWRREAAGATHFGVVWSRTIAEDHWKPEAAVPSFKGLKQTPDPATSAGQSSAGKSPCRSGLGGDAQDFLRMTVILTLQASSAARL